MANLPLTGSQYWGAALNNYLRQLNTDIDDLKIQLANFTIAASYSGSGWTESTYLLSDLSGMTALDQNPGVYTINDTSTAKMQGTLVFSSGTSTTSVTLEASSNIYMSFRVGDTTDATKRVVHVLDYDTSKNTYSVANRTTNLASTCTSNGFYPVYAVNDSTQGFKLAINPKQEFIFSENYILMGLIEKFGTDFRFIKKTDSAFKNLFTTREGNLKSFATIVSPEGLFGLANGKTTLNISSVRVDYHSNGISERGDEASSSSSEGVSNDYKAPNDYKRFTNLGGNRRCFIIDYTTGATPEINEEWLSVSSLTSILNNFNNSYVYGIYISVSGDFFIEKSAQAYQDEALVAFASSAAWNLNANSRFRTAGLVLLGACYWDKTLNDWRPLQAASNSISPEFITNRYTENAEMIRWPSVKYTTNTLANGGAATTFANYQYKVIVPDTIPAKTSDIKMMVNYAGTGDSNCFELPIAPDQFYTPIITSNAFTGLNIGPARINVAENDDVLASLTIESNGVIKSRQQFFSSNNDDMGGDIAAGETYNTVLRNTLMRGPLTIDGAATDTMTISRTISGLPAITSSTLAITSDALVLNGGTNGITIKGTGGIKGDGTNNLTISANTLELKSVNRIQCDNSITFTSDARYKTNIQTLDEEVCYNAIKNIDAKTFTYLDSNIDSLGLIAQEIEEYLPEYKDLIVDIVDDGINNDKRMVSEIKLLFILWQAVKRLINMKEAR
jgi:hypothetical protein